VRFWVEPTRKPRQIFCTLVVIKGLVTCGFEPICNPVAIGGLITRGFEPIFLYPGSDQGSNYSWF
jgi:hypothetical protein